MNVADAFRKLPRFPSWAQRDFATARLAMVKMDTPKVSMTDAERRVIRSYAAGNRGLFDQAVAIHRKYIPILGTRGSPEQRFMAEVDHPQPDLGLKAQYRAELLGTDR